MNVPVSALDEVAEVLASQGAPDLLRALGVRKDWPLLCHDLALALFVAGKHDALRPVLGLYADLFRSRPVAIREPYVFQRIGEGAAVLGTLAHLRRMKKLPVLPVLLVQGSCNPAYIEHWRKHFDIVTGEATLAEHYGDIPSMRCGFLPDTEGNMHHVGEAYALARMMDDRPLLELSEEEIERGREALHKLGMPRHAWFVCIHARSPAYLKAAGVDDSHNEYRNTDVRTFARAALQIAERGGWVVRIGAPDVERLPAWPNSIDLPAYYPSAGWLDVFAMGACRFFLGDSSGPIAAAATFGRECVGVNLQLGSPSSWMALHMPKLYRRGGKMLTVSEAIGAGMFMRQKPPPEGIEVVDNTAEEIEAAMVSVMDGPTIEYVNQQLYLNAFSLETCRLTGNASPQFLAAHRDLLG